MPKINNYLKIIVFLLLLVFLATFLIHKINLPTDDLGRHIKAGQIIWQTQSVPKVNLFSYAEPQHAFINHHWLSELLFYWVYSVLGFSGLVILKITVLLLAFGLLYFLTIRRSNFWWATLFGFLSILIFVERTDVRPEMFSYLLVAIYLLIFHLYTTGKTKVIWWLIPLQLLWVNLHIYFFLGPFLILVFFIQQLINQSHLKWWQDLKRFLPHSRPAAPIYSLFWLTLACFLVLVINPNFIQGALYPLFVLQNYGYDIVENKSPFFLQDLMQNPAILHFKILISLIIIAFVFNHRRTTLFDFITGAFAIFLGWFALRNFPLTVLLALPVLAVNFHQAFNRFFNWLEYKLGNHLNYIQLSLSIVVIAFLSLISYANYTQQTRLAFIYTKHPGIGITQGSADVAQFYLNYKIQGPVFNNFDIGSYLDFYLYPQQQTFVDNRPEAFTPEFWQFVYIPAQSDPAWWQAFDNHYQFNSIVFGHTDVTGWARSFISRIIYDDNWVTIYIDQHAMLLVKQNQTNQHLIDQFAISPAQVQNKINQYMSTKVKVDTELQQQRLKGLQYIRQHFGNLGSL